MTEIQGNLGFTTSQSPVDNILGSGEHKIDEAIITENQTLLLGAPLNRFDNGGNIEWRLVDGAGAPGTTEVHGILLEDVTTGAGEEKRASVAVFGNILTEGIVLAGTNYAAVEDMKITMRDNGLYQQLSVKNV